MTRDSKRYKRCCMQPQHFLRTAECAAGYKGKAEVEPCVTDAPYALKGCATRQQSSAIFGSPKPETGHCTILPAHNRWDGAFNAFDSQTWLLADVLQDILDTCLGLPLGAAITFRFQKP